MIAETHVEPSEAKREGVAMKTTRPIAGREPVKDVAAKRAQVSNTGDASKTGRTAATQIAENAPAQVAESVQSTAKLMDVAEQEFKRADEERIENLKKAVKEGKFKVNPRELAARLVADAFDEF